MEKRKKLLIVDDDPIQLSLAESILKAEYDVVATASGKEALDHLYHSFIPDLILLDILMPEMGGFEVYKRIRAISLLQNIPIAFLTSVSGSNEMKQALDIGAADYIMKPYTKESLLRRIRDVLQNSQYSKTMDV